MGLATTALVVAMDPFGAAQVMERHSETIFANIISPFYGFGQGRKHQDCPVRDTAMSETSCATFVADLRSGRRDNHHAGPYSCPSDKEQFFRPTPMVMLIGQGDLAALDWPRGYLSYCHHLHYLQQLVERDPAAIFIDIRFAIRQPGDRFPTTGADMGTDTGTGKVDGEDLATTAQDDCPLTNDAAGLRRFLEQVGALQQTRPHAGAITSPKARAPAIPIYLALHPRDRATLMADWPDQIPPPQLVTLTVTKDDRLLTDHAAPGGPAPTVHTPAPQIMADWCAAYGCPFDAGRLLAPAAPLYVQWGRYRSFDYNTQFDLYQGDGRCRRVGRDPIGALDRAGTSLSVFAQHLLPTTDNGAAGAQRPCPAIPYIYLYNLVQNRYQDWAHPQGDLDGLHQADPVKDRVIFVGRDLNADGDRIHSPVNGPVPGVFLHAMALDNLWVFEGRPLRHPTGVVRHLDSADLIELGVMFLSAVAAFTIRDQFMGPTAFAARPPLQKRAMAYGASLLLLIPITLFLLFFVSFYVMRQSPAGWLGTLGAIFFGFSIYHLAARPDAPPASLEGARKGE